MSDNLTEREQQLAIRSYENFRRAEAAESRLRVVERKLREAGETFAARVAEDPAERLQLARSFEESPSKMLAEIQADPHRALYGRELSEAEDEAQRQAIARNLGIAPGEVV
jgi:hypothetical protein